MLHLKQVVLVLIWLQQIIVHKAGIKNKISYVFLADIVNIELEERY